MKQNDLGLCSMTMALTIGVCVASLVMAQPPVGNDGRRDNPPRFELGQVFPPALVEDLNLTTNQKAELEVIKKELKTKLEKLLTDNQKRAVENFRPRGPGGTRGPGGPAGPERPTAQQSPTERESSAPVKLKELPNGVTRAPVVFSAGHETDPRDGGRPVVLIAAALGVTSDVFRDAFSKVLPARGGAEPDAAQVRQNKAVLMEALGKHGIDNDTLDTVSNYYRFPPGRNSIWTNKAAVANALVKDGAVIGYEIVSGGSGYTSIPTAFVPGIKGANTKVEISYGKTFETNGAVTAIAIVP